MSDVPRARALVEAAVLRIEAGRAADAKRLLLEALPLLWRRSPARPRAPVRSRHVDARTADAIRRYAHRHQETPLHEIAALFGTNQGRVSEALHHDR